jgi:SAM-dependent methyltransferase
MHDSAFKIGGLAIDFYCPKNVGSILEIGSLDVNGSLRNHSPKVNRYIGLDFSPGEGVDHVITGLDPWPVDDSSFDLVIASSVLEHDPHFWETFVKMVRKTRPGGHVYLNAPSNGWVHRYPLDCWRFYPDSASALVKWASAQGFPVSLVESFTAKRVDDVWNDWCAVFRRDPTSKPLPERMIHESVPCKNIICWKSDEILQFGEQPEDMTIIAQQRDAQQRLEHHIEEIRCEIDHASRREQQLSSTVEELEDQVSVQAAAIEDFEQTRALEADAVSKEIAALGAASEALSADLAQAKMEAAAANNMLSKQRLNFAEVERASAQREVLAKEDLLRALRERLALEQRLRRTTGELSQVARLLGDTVDERDRAAGQAAWLLSVLSVAETTPRFWAFLPAKWRRDKLIARLSRRGLFDGAAYLSRYPDVAATSMNPLTHYLRHGMSEGREIVRLEKPA